MPLNANALTTLANQKDYLGITSSTHDNLLELLINASSEWLENEMSRVILKPASDIEELHDGDFDGTGRDKIFTRRWPIVSVTKIEYKSGSLGSPVWVVFTADEWTADETAGIIYFTSGLSRLHPSRNNIRLTYQGGFASVPPDLELACLKMTAKEYDKRRSQGITQESVGGGTVTWNENVDPEILKIARKYRRFA